MKQSKQSLTILYNVNSRSRPTTRGASKSAPRRKIK